MFLAAAAVLVASLFTAVPARAGLQESFGSEEPGQHIYDQAGLLAPEEVGDLERRAAAVEEAGAPAIVYLREREATYEETEEDARELMDEWDFESSSGARDGLVVFLNLDPENPRHGQVALYAGRELVDGPLPRSELRRVSDDEVIPLLAEERTAEGISAGLDAVAEDLQSGGPDSSATAYFTAAFLARWPAGVVAVLCAVVVAALILWTKRKEPRKVATTSLAIDPPSDLAPALVAKLLGRGRAHEWAEATILDLGRRGALSVEPAGLKSHEEVQVRLLDEKVPILEHERRIFGVLGRRADEDGVVPEEALHRLHSTWGYVGKPLSDELAASGLLDPEVAARRKRLYVAGTVSLVLGYLASACAISGKEPSGYTAVLVLLASGLSAIAYAYYGLRGRTPAGERETARWRGYLSGLVSGRGFSPTNLEKAAPYAVASGESKAVEGLLEDAGERGHLPSWFSEPAGSDRAWEGNFFPHWVALRDALVPPRLGDLGSTGAAGAGHAGGAAAGGGASAGGGGAGGGF